jgi:hypothetical protein
MKLYSFGLLPIKKPFIALEIEIGTLPSGIQEKAINGNAFTVQVGTGTNVSGYPRRRPQATLAAEKATPKMKQPIVAKRSIGDR